MKYRPDIDGLRAVAVLAVLFYHAGFDFFSGGFVGVDVFFVISGFLITKKIADEIAEHKFTLVNFYEKRIRRIFPALFTTIFLTLIIGAWLYDTATFKELGQSATTTTLFVSNIFFWTRSGYFDSPSSLKPLLHMWSLSVEEQFYLGLPLLLVLLFHFFKKQVRLILGLIAGISFIAVVYILGRDSSAAFFLTPGRIWELLAGSLLALSKASDLKSFHRNLLSACGISMILASIVIYSDETLFPGAAAILPVLGSALIIFSGIGGKSWIGKLLSTKPFVFIGKISYSLYLWHWPLLVFARVYLIREMTRLDLAIWFFIIFLISFLSWKMIETPFRSLSFLPKPKIFYLAGTVMALTGIVGVAIHLTSGLPIRFKTEQAIILDEGVWNGERQHWLDCVSEDNFEPCHIGADNPSPVFILWGDSHAGALAPAVNLSASQAGLSGYIFWRSGCPPLVGIDRTTNQNQECSKLNNQTIDFIRDHHEIDTVILHSRWSRSANTTVGKFEDRKPVTLVDTEIPANSNLGNEVLFEIGLQRTVAELTDLGLDVVLVSAVPEIGYHVPSLFFVAERTGRDITSLIAPSVEEYQARNEYVITVLQDLAGKNSNVQLVDPAAILCDGSICRVVLDSKPLYRDDDHLSTFGAYQIAEIFNPIFSRKSNR